MTAPRRLSIATEGFRGALQILATFFDVGSIVLDEDSISVTVDPIGETIDLPDDLVVTLDDASQVIALSETERVITLEETELDIDRTCD